MAWNSFFLKPNNLWGRFVARTILIQNITLIVCFLISISYPITLISQQWYQIKQLNNKIDELDQSLSHQRNSFNNFKKQFDNQKITPELTKELPLINNNLQKLTKNIKIENMNWEFSEQPTLHLVMLGRFLDIKKFLTDISEKIPELKFISLQIFSLEESNYSIQTEVLFKFKPKRNNK